MRATVTGSVAVAALVLACLGGCAARDPGPEPDLSWTDALVADVPVGCSTASLSVDWGVLVTGATQSLAGIRIADVPTAAVADGPLLLPDGPARALELVPRVRGAVDALHDRAAWASFLADRWSTWSADTSDPEIAERWSRYPAIRGYGLDDVPYTVSQPGRYLVGFTVAADIVPFVLRDCRGDLLASGALVLPNTIGSIAAALVACTNTGLGRVAPDLVATMTAYCASGVVDG